MIDRIIKGLLVVNAVIWFIYGILLIADIDRVLKFI